MALSDPLGVLRNLYPQARVTSTYRSPNSPLGRANPRSYHNIGQAFDVAPIPGVSFGDYVNSLKSNGVPVVEALDEASNPKPWTTGPNWHIAFGASQVAPQRKPRTLADIAAPDLNAPAPVNVAAAPYAPQTLGDLTQQMPQGAIPEKQHSKLNFGNIAGVLGDALMAYGGLKPQFGPMMAQQNQDDRQMAFDREKLNTTVQLAREKALRAPEPSQTERLMQRYLDPTTPPREKALIHSVLMRPLVATVTAPDGSQTQQPYYADEAGNDDDWEYSN